MLKRILVALLASMAFAALAADAPDRAADEAAIRQLTQAFIDRRERFDADGLRELLTEHADQQLASGAIRAGREAVVAGSLEATRSLGGRRSIDLETIRFLGDNVAIANGSYDSTGRHDGTVQRLLTTMVFWRVDGQWKIDAIRNVRAPE